MIHTKQFKGHDYQLIAGHQLEDSLSSKAFPIFSPSVINFFGEISSLCLPLCISQDLKPFSAFFFYIRPKNLHNLFKASSYSLSSVGLGPSFNIAPSNVPLNAFYTLLFTLLSGSPCLLRISELTISNLNQFFPVIQSVYANYLGSIPNFSIVTFPRASQLTSLLSEYCSSRVVWGGDATAAQIRKLPCPPSCKDIFFPNRQSCAVVDLKSLYSSSSSEEIFLPFAKDISMFSQQACSSPLHLFFLDSTPDDLALIYQFFFELNSSISSLSFSSYTPKDCLESALNLNLSTPSLIPFYSGRHLRASSLPRYEYEPNLSNRKNGNVTFSLAKSIDKLQFNYHYQTIVLIPYPDIKLRRIFFLQYYNSFDRLVKPGRAIDMHIHWDGNDIIRALSRQVFY